MRKRPICLLCLLFMIAIWLMYLGGLPDYLENRETSAIQQYLESGDTATVYGEIYRRSIKDDSNVVYLKNTYLLIHSNHYSIQNIKIYTEEPCRMPIGSHVSVLGAVSRIAPPGNPGEFDSRLYYGVQHIDYQMSGERMKRIGSHQSVIGEWAAITQEHFRKTLVYLLPREGGVLSAMLLGDKSELDPEIRNRYQMAGIVHILAISGLHITLIGMGLYKILLKIGAHQILAGCIAMCMLYLYGLFTGGSAATLRALVMFALVIGGQLIGRSYDLLSALALSAILLLVDSPKYLFYSGFLLSFSTVMGMGYVLPVLERLAVSESRIGKLLLSPVAIWLSSMPLILYFYYELPVYSLLVNLLLLPLLPVALVSGGLSAILAQWNLWMGKIIIVPAGFILKIYEMVCDVVARLPYGTLIIGQPEKWQMAIYYGMLLLILAMLNRKRDKNIPREILALSGILLAVLWVTISPGIFRTKEFTLTALDVGQGDCHVLKTPTQSTHIIDGGSSNRKKIGSYCLIPYLKSQGVRTITCAWISHTDDDHMNGILELLEAIDQRTTSLRLNCLALPDWKTKPENYQKLENLAKKCGIPVIYIKKGKAYQDGEVTLKALAPVSDYDPEEDANGGSEVLEVSYRDFRGLYTGDIGEEQEQQLHDELKDCDFLKVAHHGSRFSTGETFLEQVQPEIAVISVSSTNRYGHPHPDTLGRLEACESRIWCTKDVGAVRVETDGRTVGVKGYRR